MANYKTEEEQVEDLKRWWEKNGKFVIIGGIVVIAGVVGGKTWKDFQITSSGKLSAQYDLMLQEMDSGNVDSAIQRATDLTDKNPDTEYALLATLAAAKMYVDKGDYDSAAQKLSATLSSTKDEKLQHIVRLRLAKVLIAQNKLDEAMTHATFPQVGAYASQYSIVKGDIYFKKGEFESAKTAYKSALSDTGLDGQLRNFVQLKLDDIGGTSVEGTL